MFEIFLLVRCTVLLPCNLWIYKELLWISKPILILNNKLFAGRAGVDGLQKLPGKRHRWQDGVVNILQSNFLRLHFQLHIFYSVHPLIHMDNIVYYNIIVLLNEIMAGKAGVGLKVVGFVRTPVQIVARDDLCISTCQRSMSCQICIWRKAYLNGSNFTSKRGLIRATQTILRNVGIT